MTKAYLAGVEEDGGSDGRSLMTCGPPKPGQNHAASATTKTQSPNLNLRMAYAPGRIMDRLSEQIKPEPSVAIVDIRGVKIVARFAR
jgi:hypothetical protein